MPSSLSWNAAPASMSLHQRRGGVRLEHGQAPDSRRPQLSRKASLFFRPGSRLWLVVRLKHCVAGLSRSAMQPVAAHESRLCSRTSGGLGTYMPSSCCMSAASLLRCTAQGQGRDKFMPCGVTMAASVLRGSPRHNPGQKTRDDRSCLQPCVPCGDMMAASVLRGSPRQHASGQETRNNLSCLQLHACLVAFLPAHTSWSDGAAAGVHQRL